MLIWLIVGEGTEMMRDGKATESLKSGILFFMANEMLSMVNLITLLDEAKLRMQVVERKLKQISSGLSILDDYERDLLNAYFVYRIKTPCEQMMKKHLKDAHQIRIDKLDALEKFTRGVYGILQT